MKTVRHILLLVTILMIGNLTPAEAESPRRPSVADIIDRLRPPSASEKLGKTRGVVVEIGQAAPPRRAEIDLEVTFKTASAHLTPDAEIVLDALGRAVMDPALISSRFEIAGHTDAAGSDAYNQKLSERRAAAARDYLVRQHHVPFGRLMTVGFGRSRLADPDHPLSEVNRRVQVTNLGPGS